MYKYARLNKVEAKINYGQFQLLAEISISIYLKVAEFVSELKEALKDQWSAN